MSITTGPPDEEPRGQVAARTGVDIGRLFDEHHAVLLRALHAHTGSRELAEDVAQDAFELAMKRRNELVDSPALRGWLFQVAFHRLQHRWRGDSRLRHAKERSMHADPPRPPSLPDGMLERRQRAEQFRALLLTLPEALREVAVLSGVAGLEGPEIAVVLGVPINTVWTRQHRAKALLKAQWCPERGGVTAMPQAPSALVTLWAWLVSFLAPELLPRVGGERRLADGLMVFARGFRPSRPNPAEVAAEALNGLSEDARAAVVLHDVVDVKEDLSEILDVSGDGLQVRLVAARAQVRAWWTGGVA